MKAVSGVADGTVCDSICDVKHTQTLSAATTNLARSAKNLGAAGGEIFGVSALSDKSCRLGGDHSAYGCPVEGVPAVGALPSASWVFGSLHGVVLGWPGGPVPFLLSPPKKTVLLYNSKDRRQTGHRLSHWILLFLSYKGGLRRGTVRATGFLEHAVRKARPDIPCSSQRSYSTCPFASAAT